MYEVDGVRLTRKQPEVVRFVGEGLTNKQIAGRLYCTESTLENHLNALYRSNSLFLRLVVREEQEALERRYDRDAIACTVSYSRDGLLPAGWVVRWARKAGVHIPKQVKRVRLALWAACVLQEDPSPVE